MQLKMYIKCGPFCSGLNVLKKTLLLSALLYNPISLPLECTARVGLLLSLISGVDCTKNGLSDRSHGRLADRPMQTTNNPKNKHRVTTVTRTHLTKGLGAYHSNFVWILLAIILILMIQSGHNFAHVMTVKLSWHVQNCDLITSLFFT